MIPTLALLLALGVAQADEPVAASPPAAAPVGVVVGKETYVYAAYAVTWITFLGYGLSLWMRRGGER